MRTDEKRVARGEATLLRTLLRKGPRKPTQANTGDILFDGDTASADINKKNHIGTERDLENLTV